MHGYNENGSRCLFQHTLNYSKDIERTIFDQSIFLHWAEMEIRKNIYNTF